MPFDTLESAFALYTYLFNQVVVLNCKDLQHFFICIFRIIYVFALCSLSIARFPGLFVITGQL
jgi:hypothetical protein